MVELVHQLYVGTPGHRSSFASETLHQTLPPILSKEKSTPDTLALRAHQSYPYPRTVTVWTLLQFAVRGNIHGVEIADNLPRFLLVQKKPNFVFLWMRSLASPTALSFQICPSSVTFLHVASKVLLRCW